MIKIPQFKLEEVEQLAEVLEEENVPFELRGTASRTPGGSRFRGTKDYLICVSDEVFPKALEIIKSYYGFTDEPLGTFSGTCPVCQTEIVDGTECPDCGLVFVMDPYEILGEHPFCKYVKKLDAQGNSSAPKGFY